MTSKPKHQLSVVMPVHNALPYLDEAVQSILGQSYSEFEFCIYDDASTDGSSERLRYWARNDRRIRLTRGDAKLGPAASSNQVVRLATSPLIARMDADDVSFPDRLEKQHDLLTRHPDVAIVASLCEVIDWQGNKIRDPELWRLARKSWFNPFPHGSLMFRRDLFEAIGGYRLECEFWEDLDFVIRASAKTRMLVLPRPLYRYRQSNSSTRISSDQRRVEQALDLRYRSIAALREGDNYDAVLTDARQDPARRLDPRVFLSLGLLELWAGQRPRLVRRLFQRARLRFNTATLLTIAWLSWARTSPAAMRMFMNLLSRLRNFAVPPMADEPVEWRVPSRLPYSDVAASPDARKRGRGVQRRDAPGSAHGRQGEGRREG
jgi:glycosyltransferase involved in cell wall biosynthesis